MISIKKDNKELYISDSEAITFKRVNTAFAAWQEDSDNRSFSFPFTLSMEDENAFFLRNINELQIVETGMTVSDVRLCVDGIEVFAGDLQFLEAKKDTAEVSFQFSARQDWAERSMSELEELGYFYTLEGTDRYQYLIFALADIEGLEVASAQDYSLFVNGQEFVQNVVVTPPADIGTLTQAVLDAFASDINASGLPVTATVSTNPFVPQLKYLRIQSTSPTDEFLVLYENDKDSAFGWVYARDEDGIKAFAEANLALPNITDSPICFPSFLIENRDFALDVNKNDGAAMLTVNKFAGAFNTNSLIPQMRVTAAIELILETFGWGLDSAFLQDAELQKLFFVNNSCAANLSTVEDYYMTDLPPLSYSGNQFFFYSDLLPNLSFKDFLKEFAKIFCLDIFWDYKTRVLRIEPVRQIFQNEVIAYPTLDDWSKRRADFESLEFKFPLSTYKNTVDKFVIKDAHLDIQASESGDLKTVEVSLNYMPAYSNINAAISEPAGLIASEFSMRPHEARRGGIINQNIYDFLLAREQGSKDLYLGFANRNALNELVAQNLSESYSLLFRFRNNNLALFWNSILLRLAETAEIEVEVLMSLAELLSFEGKTISRANENTNLFVREWEWTASGAMQDFYLVKKTCIRV